MYIYCQNKEVHIKFRIQLIIVDSVYTHSLNDMSIALALINLFANYIAAVYGFGSLFSIFTELFSALPLLIFFAARYELVLDYSKS